MKTAPDAAPALPPHVTVGTDNGAVLLGLGMDGEDGVHQEIHTNLLPEQARAVAWELARFADEIDGTPR